MSKSVFSFLLLISAALFILVILRIQPTMRHITMERAHVSIGSAQFDARVADTRALRAQGLSGSAPLADGEGMLFLFEKPGIYGFWMKGMTFPIDIVWIRSGKVIGYEEHLAAPPLLARNEEIETFYPPGEIDAVLEISAGAARKAGIQSGQDVIIRKQSN